MKLQFTKFIFASLILFSTISLSGQNSTSFYLEYGSNCEPVNVNVNNTSMIYTFTGGLSYEWRIDGIVVDTAQFPAPQTLFKGHHMIELNIWDDVSHLGYYSEMIDVSGLVDTFHVEQGLTACPGEEVFFSVWSELYIYYVEWDFGDGGLLDGYSKYENNPVHTYLNEGIYTVNLLVDNECGSNSISQEIEILSTAIPEFNPYIYGSSIICPNEEISFNVDGNLTNYLWDFGDGNTSDLRDPVHTYPDQDTASYNVTLTATNICGNTNTKSVEVVIDYNPEANSWFDFHTNSHYPDPCPGTKIYFYSHSSGTHHWKFGDGGESFERDPIYRYSQEGEYTVEHIILTGCGISDTAVQTINVLINPDEIVYDLSFMFEYDMDWDQLQYLDTLTVCTGEYVSFRNHSYYYNEVIYNWDFGDGGSTTARDARHKFDVPGLHEVILTATTGCGGVTSVSKYVNVDPGVKPEAFLGILPLEICPDETVYFFDDNFRPNNNYKYHIDFGDGTVINDITGITDLELHTIAQHQYSGTGPFNFIFKAENICGNFVETSGAVFINNDETRKPFYHVSNSTQDGSKREPTDWSVQNDATDHQLDILVQWDAWLPIYGDTFFIYFWYEGLYVQDDTVPMEGETAPEGDDPGPPDGIVKFVSANIVVGETVTAWAPMNMMGMNEVGIAAGYFCGEINLEDEPEAWGTLMDGTMQMINSIPLSPGGYTLITDISPLGIKIDPLWDGVCNSEKPEGSWFREVSPGIFAVLELYEDMDGYYYFMEYRDGLDHWMESNYISGGPYIYPSYPDVSTIEFQDYGCGGAVPYNFTKPNENQLQFSPSVDSCADRVLFLDGIFERYHYNDDYRPDMSVCPGDMVKFQIAGGLSYVWDFGDGNTSTEQFPIHSYSAPGVYNAFVTATNSCGRVDILNTNVNISDTNIPDASFGIENMDVSRMDTAWFRYYNYNEYGGNIDNNTYLWNFGDGKTSTLRNPYHIYTEAGEYNVRLEVTNSCGSNSAEQHIWVNEKILLCEAKFDFSIDSTNSLNVQFADLSLGGSTQWEWDFGDGTFSNEQNPIHRYTTDGAYFVSLTTFNDQNDCLSSVVRKLIVGNVTCDAGFSFIVNNTSGLVKFINTSLNTGEYFWDFGDNTVSELEKPEHTYKDLGIYTVCLTVFDNNTGCQSVYCTEVQVGADENTLVKADFSYFLLDDGQSVTFSDLSAGNITQWYWTTGDGKMISKSSFIHTFTGPGMYDVCLVVFDENTGNSDEICKTIRVGEVACLISAEFDFFVKPSTKEIYMEDRSLGNPEKWYWTFGDGSTSESQNPQHQYDTPGFYLITLSVFDATNDCMDHFAKFIQIGAVECKADFEAQINPETLEVNLVNTSTGPIEKFYWDFGNGKFSTVKSPSFAYPKPGEYVIGLTVIDSSEVCLDHIVKEIQVGEIDCSAGFEYYIESTTATAFFHNSIIGNYTQMLWIFGDGTYTTEENPVHQFSAPGYYTVSLNTYNTENDCMDYFETILLVGDEGMDCQADFIYQPEDLANSIRFKDESFGNIQHHVWNFGDGNQSDEFDPIHEYPEPGYYLTCLTVWNNFGIPNMQCKWIPVAPSSATDCRADFMFTVDSLSRDVVFVDNSIGEPDTYSWDFGDGNGSTEANPGHTYSEKGFYTVILDIENSLSGCSSKEVKLLNVSEEYILKAAFDYEVDTSGTKASGYPVDFVGASSGDGASYEWDFGDKNLKSFTVMDSSTKIVTHYYEDPGIYNACLRVSDPITNQTDTYCEPVRTSSSTNVYDFSLNMAELDVYPNPANEFTTISYSLPENIHIEIAIFDAMGRRIETLVRTEKKNGNHKIIWNSNSIQSGLYYIKLMTRKQIITQPLVISR